MQNEYFVCMPGWGEGENTYPFKGGAGWEDGKLMRNKASNSFSDESEWIVWPETGGNGIYYKAVRHATDDEIAQYNRGIRNIKDILSTYQIY